MDDQEFNDYERRINRLGGEDLTAAEVERVFAAMGRYRKEAALMVSQSGSWTGRMCGKCNGTGETPDLAGGQCGGCAGTGDEYLSFREQVRLAVAELTETKAELARVMAAALQCQRTLCKVTGKEIEG